MITRILHNIGDRKNSNYNTLAEIHECQDFLTFDGVYENVFHNRSILAGRKAILFIAGDYVGKDNRFDAPMPLEKYCTWEQLAYLKACGFELGWHSWSHRDLTTLETGEIIKEVTPPFPMRTFAYPYGKFDDRVLEAVKKAGFQEAYSVFQGDGSEFQRLRKYLNW